MKHSKIREEWLSAIAKRKAFLESDIAKTYLRLQWTSNALWEEVDDVFSRFGISQDCFAVLMILDEIPAQSRPLSFIAKECGVEPPTMTRVIDALEKDGYVNRRKDTYDHRCYNVYLTEAGKIKLDEVLPAFLQSVSQTMSRLSKKEYYNFTDLLQKLFQDHVLPKQCQRDDMTSLEAPNRDLVCTF